MAEQILTLNPGESEAVSFEVTPQEAGVYQVIVNGLAGSFVAVEAAKGMVTLYATGLRPEPVDWYISWYYDGKWRVHIEEDGTYSKRAWESCTPPEPIDLNNLIFRVHDYSEQEKCPATGYYGACRWGPFGPFTVEHGRIYTINIRTGELTEGAPAE